MGVDVVPYDPEWSIRFARIRAELAEALRAVEVVAIEHVGSTSVPGLEAKPIVDVDVVVERGAFDAALRALEAAGYVHRGDLSIPDRHAFAAPPGGDPRNVYLVVQGSLALRNHLAVRDALRRDPALRDAYGRLKRELASGSGVDVGRYTVDKTEFLTAVLAGAGFTDAELESIARANVR